MQKLPSRTSLLIKNKELELKEVDQDEPIKEENFADLKTTLDQLKDRRNDVMRRVNVADLKNLRPLDEVRGWLSRTETMINEVDALLTEGPEQIKKLCVGGCYSKNCKAKLPSNLAE